MRGVRFGVRLAAGIHHPLERDGLPSLCYVELGELGDQAARCTKVTAGRRTPKEAVMQLLLRLSTSLLDNVPREHR